MRSRNRLSPRSAPTIQPPWALLVGVAAGGGGAAGAGRGGTRCRVDHAQLKSAQPMSSPKMNRKLGGASFVAVVATEKLGPMVAETVRRSHSSGDIILAAVGGGGCRGGRAGGRAGGAPAAA
eukprot:COSAG01_NODE_4706_length_4799_cov_68.341277_7_plen_121_part_01